MFSVGSRAIGILGGGPKRPTSLPGSVIGSVRFCGSGLVMLARTKIYDVSLGDRAFSSLSAGRMVGQTMREGFCCRAFLVSDGSEV